MTEENGPQNATQPDRASDRKSGKLERAWARRRLIIDLAKEEQSQRELATKYGVAQSSISEFRTRHLDEILATQTDLENEFVQLWVTQKIDRLAEIQELYESSTLTPRQIETRLAALRHAAEELGQIPNRTTVDFAQPVEVVIKNADDV